MSTREVRRYRFGPLERRGLVGGLRPVQVAVAAASLAIGVVLMRLLPNGVGVFPAIGIVLLALVVCFWPVSGRSLEEWSPVALRHVRAKLSGRNRFRSGAPTAGTLASPDGEPIPPVSLPAALSDVELLTAPFRGEVVGVIKDARAKTYTAVLAVRVTSFGLLDSAEQESRQAAWGGVLAGLAREGSPVSRIQWVERTVPADGDEIGRYLGDRWARDVVEFESLPMQSYLDLVSTAPAVTKDHELFVALQIDAKRAWRQIKKCGGRKGVDQAASAVLMREVEMLADRLSGADVTVIGALRPGMLATAIRIGFDPWRRPGVTRLNGSDPDAPGAEAATWPVATDSTWTTYRTDGAFHATYWIAGWPRIDVGAAFLSPLLLNAQAARAISVTHEPISPSRAVREVEAAHTSDVADRELRGRMGFIESARRRRVADATTQREEELADGHAAIRFAGFVTVSAPTLDGLEQDCSEIEHAAQMARLDLVRLYGQQEEGFTFTLPLGRGLR